MTTFVPIGKILPLTGEHVTEGGAQPPLALLAYATGAPFELVAATVAVEELAGKMGGGDCGNGQKKYADSRTSKTGPIVAFPGAGGAGVQLPLV